MAFRYTDSIPETDDGPLADKWIRLGVLLALLLLIALALVVARRPRDLVEGVWVSPEGPERLALEFTTSKLLAAGTAHQLREGKEVVQWGFAGTISRDGKLDLQSGSKITLTGTVDLEEEVVEVRVVPVEGPVYDITLRRAEARDVPGLAALPELSYRLRPPADASGWDTASPPDVGVRPRDLEQTVQAVARGEAGLLHSVVVVRHGKLLAEEYFHGYRRDDLHELHAATQSVTSLLVGIAVDQGVIDSLDEPVLDYFPGIEIDDPRWRDVTLRHLLTMQAGVDWDRHEALDEPGTGPPWFRQVFLRRIAHAPGSRWLFNGADVNLLAGVLHQATGMHADAFAERFLFTPLGITEWSWEKGKRDGYPSLAGTLELRPLDMAKIGQLVLDGGRWRGEQVVSEEWIAESTAPRVETDGNTERFGYLWRRVRAPIGDAEHPVIVAAGLGSQFIHIVPELDAIVVTTGGNQLNNKTWRIGGVLLRHLVTGIEGYRIAP